MKTAMLRKEDVKRKWYVLDARDKILGRLATQAASILRGKHKASFTPHVDDGDFVVIVNADKFQVTGKKMKQKKYAYYSGYPGGYREVTLENMLQRKPTEAMRLAVKRMLPKGPLGRRMYKKLKVFVGDKHPFKEAKEFKY